MSRPVSSDVQLDDEFSHFQDLPADHLAEHFQDHIGVGIWGSAGDKDIYIADTIYHVGGRLWGIDDGTVIQTNLLFSPTDDRVMKDNAFLANRMDPLRHFDDLEVVKQSDKVIWKVGNRQIICYPPYWEIKGEHFGLDLDIKISGIGNSVPHHGTWQDFATNGVAGNEQIGRAEGTFTYNGETYTLDDGWAVRERECLGKGWDVPSLVGAAQGYVWGWCFSDALTVFFFSQEGSGHSASRVYLEDRTVDFGADDMVVEVLESWLDPLTHATQPTSWRVRMKSAAGSLELDVATWSRCLFGFHLLEGYTTHHAALGRTSGRYVSPDGDVIPLDDARTYVEQGFATPLAAG